MLPFFFRYSKFLTRSSMRSLQRLQIQRWCNLSSEMMFIPPADAQDSLHWLQYLPPD
ncbi:hypothetical protein GALL_365030 [mine drainage metagenome]|uniref:Uncharacterized protein n=1 Tax=mine drainage metagenome TaxID=410659 RepID=A0A1J5QE37_9ZZZZ